MKAFNKKLSRYFTFYKTPIAKDQLDPTLFYFPETGEYPVLHQGVHAHILNDMEMFCSNQPSRIKTCCIVGDAVTPGKGSKEWPVKVMIVLNKQILDADIDGLLAEEILKLSKSLSNRMIVGTTRRIEYIPTVRNVRKEDYDGIYEIPSQQWIKKPSGLR